jgi:HPr kinase/phosphorylase
MTGHRLAMADTALLHATCISVDGFGLLFLGPPGSGKSDLALRLIDQPGGGLSGVEKVSHLVADDQVLIRRDVDALIASPPAALAGLLEVRGLGPMRVRHLPEVTLAAAIRLVPHPEIERLPDHPAHRHGLLGLTLPLLAVDPAEASAPARIRAAADWLKTL